MKSVLTLQARSTPINPSGSSASPIPLSGPLASLRLPPASQLRSDKTLPPPRPNRSPRTSACPDDPRGPISAGLYASLQRVSLQSNQSTSSKPRSCSSSNTTPAPPARQAKWGTYGDTIWCDRPHEHSGTCCCLITSRSQNDDHQYLSVPSPSSNRSGCRCGERRLEQIKWMIDNDQALRDLVLSRLPPSTPTPSQQTSPSSASPGSRNRPQPSQVEIVWCDYPLHHPESCCCAITQKRNTEGRNESNQEQYDLGPLIDFFFGLANLSGGPGDGGDGGSGPGSVSGMDGFCECHGHPGGCFDASGCSGGGGDGGGNDGGSGGASGCSSSCGGGGCGGGGG
ncbi:uncharacterized protein I303_105178 [Kwoniella dejecticola CBS 10117]|uniref:Uncharacterized protein n=1 Tax=Kwoniella dejecticola CBS 10117 TaxID=1296121 RepID=A0A1A6A374_9TREE|nr:uncharacterized protein I303_05375 [Kwoniella dejecticola CBS 10117]OBR84517.1 hypothetical protein I303_05375 [Kwoniella dejecticola CBS 10117]